MANTNAISPFFNATPAQLQEAVGITQFPTDTEWFHTFGGLLMQGGRVNIPGGTAVLIPYNAGFPTQVLCIMAQPLDSSATFHISGYTSLADFTLHNTGSDKDFFWWAIGV